MKNLKVLALITLLSIQQSIAQPGGGGGGRPPQGGGGGGQERSGEQINPETLVGIMTLDFEKVSRKLKVKEESQKTVLYKLVGDYNNKMYILKDENQDLFDQMKERPAAGSRSTGDSQRGSDPRAQMDELKDQTARLTADMKSNVSNALTSSKQQKKWDKFMKKKENELAANQPSRPDGQGSSGGQGQGGRGQRQGGF